MAVRLEDHETAILELEGQVELLEKKVRDVETFMAVLDTMETRVQETQRVVAEFGKKPTSNFVLTKMQSPCGMARRSSRSWHMPSRTWSDGVTSRVFQYLRPLQDRVTNLEQCRS